MRRRIVLAVILLIALVVVVRIALLARDFDTIVTADQFEAARADYTELRAFLRRMPKGGDLHVHLSGAVYAERFIAWAAQDGLCVNLADVMQAGTHCDQPGDVPISPTPCRISKFYDRLVNAFSTRAYLPSVHVPTEHDAFFATFAKFGAASGSHFAEMMVDQLRQYHERQRAIRRVHDRRSPVPSDKDKFMAAISAQAR